jgi:hypothetical protein
LRNIFGPDVNAITITTGPEAPPSASTTPRTKQDVRVDFKGVDGTGPVTFKFALPVYDQANSNTLTRIGVAALPLSETMPATADELIGHPKAIVNWSDTSAMQGGGEVAIVATLPNGQYAGKSILTFDQ